MGVWKNGEHLASSNSGRSSRKRMARVCFKYPPRWLSLLSEKRNGRWFFCTFPLGMFFWSCDATRPLHQGCTWKIRARYQSGKTRDRRRNQSCRWTSGGQCRRRQPEFSGNSLNTSPSLLLHLIPLDDSGSVFTPLSRIPKYSSWLGKSLGIIVLKSPLLAFLGTLGTWILGWMTCFLFGIGIYTREFTQYREYDCRWSKRLSFIIKTLEVDDMKWFDQQ